MPSATLADDLPVGLFHRRARAHQIALLDGLIDHPLALGTQPTPRFARSGSIRDETGGLCGAFVSGRSGVARFAPTVAAPARPHECGPWQVHRRPSALAAPPHGAAPVPNWACPRCVAVPDARPVPVPGAMALHTSRQPALREAVLNGFPGCVPACHAGNRTCKADRPTGPIDSDGTDSVFTWATLPEITRA